MAFFDSARSDFALVVGGGGMTEMRAVGDDAVLVESTPVVRISAAVAISREFAADLAIFLEKDFAIDEAFKAERKKRYPNHFTQSDASNV